MFVRVPEYRSPSRTPSPRPSLSSRNSNRASDSGSALFVPRWRRGKAAYEPALGEENGASQKEGNARRVNPGVVDILPDIQKRPEKERADAKILNDLGSLVREGRETLAIGSIGEISKF